MSTGSDAWTWRSGMKELETNWGWGGRQLAGSRLAVCVELGGCHSAWVRCHRLRARECERKWTFYCFDSSKKD